MSPPVKPRTSSRHPAAGGSHGVTGNAWSLSVTRYRSWCVVQSKMILTGWPIAAHKICEPTGWPRSVVTATAHCRFVRPTGQM